MKTHELLKMTQEAYELLIFDWWLSFCLHKAPSEKQVQKLLVNNTLFQWWRAQLAAAEEVFVEEARMPKSSMPKPYIEYNCNTTTVY